MVDIKISRRFDVLLKSDNKTQVFPFKDKLDAIQNYSLYQIRSGTMKNELTEVCLQEVNTVTDDMGTVTFRDKIASFETYR